jgi:nucleoid-associated protein YgaU
MEDRSSKVYFGLCILVLIWIGVYWAWEPSKSTKPKISMSQPQKPVIKQEPTQTVPDPVSEKQQTIELLPPEPEPKQKLIPPEFQTHTVAQNEIMQDIARQYYGKSSMWNVIARANPRIDPLKLRTGMTLRIPTDPDNIQGIVESPDDSKANDPQPETQTVEYIVQPGDSLSRIAQNYYGSSRHADFIFQSNRDTLRSMDAIRVGQTLKLPPLDP